MLKCGKDYSISDVLLKEMGRVVKENNKIFIITHGAPESRSYLFGRSLGYEQYIYSFCKQSINLIKTILFMF